MAAGRGGPVGVLAEGLRSLRDNAGEPVGAELELVTGLGAEMIRDALGGRMLPALPTTLALVEAWGGDVEAWETYWNQIAELVGKEEEGRKGKGAREQGSAGPDAGGPGQVARAAAAAGQRALAEAGKTTGKAAGEAAAKEGPAGARRDQDAVPDAPLYPAETAKHDAAQEAAVRDAESEKAKAKAKAKEPRKAAAGAKEAAGPTEKAADPAKAPDSAASSTAAISGLPTTEPADFMASSKEAMAGHPAAQPADTAAVSTSSTAAMAGLPPAKSNEAGSDGSGGEASSRRRPRLSWVVRIAIVAVVLILVEVAYLAYAGLTKTSNPPEAQQPPAPGTTTLTGTAPPSGSDSSDLLPSTTPSVSPSVSVTSSASEFPTFPSPAPSDSSSTVFHSPGTQLGIYPKVQLPSGYSVDLLQDTFHPVAGSGLGGDTVGFTATGPLDGTFFAPQVVVFDVDEPGTYERCLNDTRYQQNVSLAGLSVGSLFCVHSPGGELALVKVDRLPQEQDGNPYVVVDLTVWQG